jgi:hypothetical protein
MGKIMRSTVDLHQIHTESLFDYLFNRICEVIQALSPETIADIYVLSLLVPMDGAMSRYSQMEFGYNTHAQRLACTPETGEKPGGDIASSPGEAKWNYAFWLHDSYITLLDRDADPVGSKLMKTWLKENGIRSDEAWSRFWELAIELAKRLRSSDLVASKFGKAIPILVHTIGMDSEDYAAIKEVNTEGQAYDFLTGW